MTENKRFELRFTGGDTFIIDNENHINHFVGFEDVTGDFKCIVGLLNELHEENRIFRTFIELNDFDADEILRQGKGLE